MHKLRNSLGVDILNNRSFCFLNPFLIFRMRVNLDFLYRKKKYDAASLENTNLSRVLNLSDLVALGNLFAIN